MSINIQNYGVRTDGVTNDAIAINKAISANPGQNAFFPKGTYYIDSQLIVPVGTVLLGEYGSTFIHGTNVINTNLVLLYGQYSSIDTIAIDGNYKAVPKFNFAEIGTYGSNASIRKCNLSNLRNIGMSAGSDHVDIQHNTITGVSNGSIGSYGIWAISNKAINQTISNNIITGTLIDAIGASGVGLKINNNYINSCQWNTSIGGGQLAIYPGSSGTTFADVSGNYIGQGGSIYSSGMELNGWASVHNNTVEYQQAAGIVLQAGQQNIVNNNVVRNTQNGPGIVTTKVLDSFKIADNFCFDDQAVATQTYGIHIHAGANQYYSLKDNQCVGNKIQNILDESTGAYTKQIRNNLGYFVGKVLQVGPSPYTYQNTRGETVILYIYGGTVSSVCANGRVVSPCSNAQAIVMPGATAVITYTAKPGIDEYGLTF